MEESFAFEDLDVWQKALDFADSVMAETETLSSNKNHYRLMDQLESAVTSVPLNIAEGKGRYSKKEFTRHLYIARGSLYETVTLLKIFNRRDWIDKNELDSIELRAMEINKMIMGLIDSINDS